MSLLKKGGISYSSSATGFDDEVGEEALFSDEVHVQKRRQTPEVDDEYEIPPFLRSDNY